MVFVAFVKNNIDTNILIINLIDRITDNYRIAEPLRVILFNEFLLVVLIIALKIFRDSKSFRRILRI